jgi:hypothetical protein
MPIKKIYKNGRCINCKIGVRNLNAPLLRRYSTSNKRKAVTRLKPLTKRYKVGFRSNYIADLPRGPGVRKSRTIQRPFVMNMNYTGRYAQPGLRTSRRARLNNPTRPAAIQRPSSPVLILPQTPPTIRRQSAASVATPRGVTRIRDTTSTPRVRRRIRLDRTRLRTPTAGSPDAETARGRTRIRHNTPRTETNIQRFIEHAQRNITRTYSQNRIETRRRSLSQRRRDLHLNTRGAPSTRTGIRHRAMPTNHQLLSGDIGGLFTRHLTELADDTHESAPIRVRDDPTRLEGSVATTAANLIQNPLGAVREAGRRLNSAASTAAAEVANQIASLVSPPRPNTGVDNPFR